jgi:hypothetical protein
MLPTITQITAATAQRNSLISSLRGGSLAYPARLVRVSVFIGPVTSPKLNHLITPRLIFDSTRKFIWAEAIKREFPPESRLYKLKSLLLNRGVVVRTVTNSRGY